MRNKMKLFITSAIAITCLIGTVLTVNNTPILLNADVVTYGMTMSSSKNKFHDPVGITPSSGNATLKTNLNNDIDFVYHNTLTNNTTWHVLSDGGYFYNETPLNGLTNITISSKTAEGALRIYYSQTNEFETYYDITTSDSTTASFNFNNTYPEYFKVENIHGSNVNIASINLTYTCLDYEPTVTVVSENEAKGTVTGGGRFAAGTEVTVTATPKDGYKFVAWFSDDELVSNSSTYTFDVGYNDITLEARFDYASYNLSIFSNNEKMGTVEGSGLYPYMSDVTVKATPNEGYDFVGWYNCVTTYVSDNKGIHNSTATMEISASKDVTLVIDYSVSSETNRDYLYITKNGSRILNHASGTKSGSITVDLNAGGYMVIYYSKNGSSNSGSDTATVSINGDPSCYTIYTNYDYSWKGKKPNLLSNENPYTFTMDKQNTNIYAKFVKIYSINLISDDTSKGTVSGPSECAAGKEVSIYAHANKGYALDYWYDDNFNQPSFEHTYTFVMPENDVTLYAAFTKGFTLTLKTSDDTLGTVIGANQYVAGREVTVKVEGERHVKHWVNSNGDIVSTTHPYTFTMPEQDYELTAVFMSEEEEEWIINHGGVPSIDSNNNTITYGLYPQTIVDDNTIINELNKLTTTESNGWYLYKDTYYAKQVADPYENSYKFSNGETIVDGYTYWFKCEPIVWRILDNDNGEYYVLSEILLDVHCYHNSSSNRTIDGKTIYANNYKHSDIRAWLNNDFYNSAFALNNEHILTTEVDNSASTTYDYSNTIVCENTLDKVFLPSYQDYQNSDYGFNSYSDRQAKVTDYVLARHAYRYNKHVAYWTRSPYGSSEFAFEIDYDCYLLTVRVYSTGIGVRPCLSISIS